MRASEQFWQVDPSDLLNWRPKSRRSPTPITELAQQIARYDEMGGVGLRLAKKKRKR
jgi:hypothetical protein